MRPEHNYFRKIYTSVSTVCQREPSWESLNAAEQRLFLHKCATLCGLTCQIFNIKLSVFCLLIQHYSIAVISYQGFCPFRIDIGGFVCKLLYKMTVTSFCLLFFYLFWCLLENSNQSLRLGRMCLKAVVITSLKFCAKTTQRFKDVFNKILQAKRNISFQRNFLP